MPFADGSINLNWAAHFEHALSVGSFSLADSGAISLLQSDPSSVRGFTLTGIVGDFNDTLGHPSTSQIAMFAADPIGDFECDPSGEAMYLLNDTAVHFLSVGATGELSHGMLQIRTGDSFLGLKAAASDIHHTAAILTTDRAQTVFTLSLLEAPLEDKPNSGSQSVSLNLLWNKAWSEKITAASISRDGRQIAIAVGKGDIALISRERRTMWTHSAPDGIPISSVAVDVNGTVICVSDSGKIFALASDDGTVMWEHKFRIEGKGLPEGIRRAAVAVDDRGGLVLAAFNQLTSGEGVTSHYTFLDGSTGEALWSDNLASGTSGVSISSSGTYAALTTLMGEILLFGAENHKPSFNINTDKLVKPHDLPHLIKKGTLAFEAYRFEKAVEYLGEAAKIDPAIGGHISLYEDSIWQLREVILSETKEVSRESLEKVDNVLALLPHDEKLTTRRNALARIIAENLGRQGSQRATAGDIDKAVELLRQAIEVDPSQMELRQTLRTVTDVVAIRLFKEADDLLVDEKFDEAIDALIRLEALRPGEEAVVKRLEQARAIQAFASGMKCYIKARYTEACFWYRKALVLMPDNAEAKRYLGLASRLGNRPQNADPKPDAMKPIWANPNFSGERTSTV